MEYPRRANFAEWEERALVLVGQLDLPEKSLICEYDVRRAVVARLATAINERRRLKVESLAASFSPRDNDHGVVLDRVAVTFISPEEKQLVADSFDSDDKSVLKDNLYPALAAMTQDASVFFKKCPATTSSATKRWQRALARCLAVGGVVLFTFLEDWLDEDCVLVGGAAPGWTDEDVLTRMEDDGNDLLRDSAASHNSSDEALIAMDPLDDDEEECEAFDETNAPQSLLDSGWGMLDLTTGREVNI